MSEYFIRCMAGKWSGRGWNREQCKNKAKGQLKDGTPACGVHLEAERRNEKNANKRKEEYRKERQYADEVAELLEKHGIDGHSNGYKQRRCIVSFDDLKGVLDEK